MRMSPDASCLYQDSPLSKDPSVHASDTFSITEDELRVKGSKFQDATTTDQPHLPPPQKKEKKKEEKSFLHSGFRSL